MLTIGILCSGGLGLETLKNIATYHTIQFVLTDNKSTEIIYFSRENHIPCFAGNPRNNRGYNFIKNFDVDVIASINYLFLIEKDIINHSKILTFNIHGSLLPKYRGRTPHVWAIINGETETGVTAHIIDEGCDTGKIIDQIKIPISLEDTGATMLAKYSRLYYPLVEKVLHAIVSDTLTLKAQDNEAATYFGKRTPDDGEINWNNNVEDIRNWVRAQAYPYPGAFSYFNAKKIIIDKVSLYNEPFDEDKYGIGEIVKLQPKLHVMCKNGIVVLDVIRTENCTFARGKTFGNENRK